jgi:flagellar hook-associated protein 2
VASISSTVGLVTGIQIGDLVDKLMAVASKPHDLLNTKNEALKKQQVAVTDLAAMVVSVRYITASMSSGTVFDTQTASSSAPATLATTVTGQPKQGAYQFTPLQLATRNEYLSSGFASDTTPIGAGTLSFRYGDDLQRGLKLDEINSGSGLTRGTIEITDRSGATGQIDLSAVGSMQDVVEAINSNADINVTASLVGDHIRLADGTGQTAANLKVSEVGGGKTAASLGLSGIDVAASTADGQDIAQLSSDMNLNSLNDGRGISISNVLEDFKFTLSNGTSWEVDLSPRASGGSTVDTDLTLGDVVDRINSVAPDSLKAEIGPDGDRLVITDLTGGTGEFKAESLFGGTALHDLGLDQTASGGTITGRRIIGGLGTVLVDSLNGGNGISLGSVQLTDRSGATDTVDLSGAETLDEVLQRINAASVGITAQLNTAKNGIELVDTTGSTAHNLTVADVGGGTTATKLGIAGSVAKSSVNGGDLHLQVVTKNTAISDLNGGAGIMRGYVSITDTTGNQAKLNLFAKDMQTVGDVITGINRLGLGVLAQINPTGDGIRLIDTAHGSGKITVAESGSTAAANLHLLGTSSEQQVGGVATQVLDGSMTYKVTLDSTNTLADLRTKINALGAGVTASAFNDGSSRPYRMSLSSDRTGAKGNLVLDTSQLGISLNETAQGRDAVLAVGAFKPGKDNVLAFSSTNTFTSALSGVSLEIKDTSTSPVTVSVSASDSDALANVKAMVSNYNRLQTGLSTYTSYNADTNTASVLTGDSAALRVESELSYMVSGRFYTGGSIQSLAQVGITVGEDGKLSLDEDKFSAAFQADPTAVKQFFSKTDTGFCARFNKLADQLAGQDVSLMALRYKALDQKISDNTDHLSKMADSLAKQKEAMLLKFYNMETAISKIQSNSSAISAIQYINADGTTSSNSSSG